MKRLVADHILYRADESAFVTASFKHLLGDEGGGRLAVCACNAYKLQPAKRMPHEILAHTGKRLSRGLHNKLIFKPKIPLAYYSRSPVRGGCGGKIVSVAL